ncbi:MAG: carboxypeptidase-like regulatory domain-containing protein [Eubacteriales bacterium]|nr:carboxypeptidase-like regulatory domain-containing protein [Eubacteriales bacterium]
MQGIVTDEKGTKVKAAIVVLTKVKDPDDESDTEVATYAETDEEGRFMIQDLNPDDKYLIEIHVEHSEIDIKKDEALEDHCIIDSLKNNSRTDDAKRRTICINNLYFISDPDRKDKLYLMQNHFW